MLADNELGQTAAQLAGFRVASEQYHATLTEVLQKYTALMEDYKGLKSDYEEARDSRERYKQMAKGQERNPFVLVLIDGDGYVFDDALVSSGAEGGQKAAGMLNDAVKNSLRTRGLDHCRIMVRVFANLAGLSKTLSKAKLAGPEKRSLAPFAASFTRSSDLFDFVDAGDLKENADFKIRAMFRLFADNPQCQHIYFAGCHDVGYLSELTPYVGNRDRITLVRTSAFHPEFAKLGMPIDNLSNLFHTLDGQAAVPSTKATPNQIFQPPNAQAANDASNICTFFQKGMCKYGKGCRYSHVKVNTNGTSTGPGSWRNNSSGENHTGPFQMAHLTKSDNDFMTGNADPTQLQIDFVTMLPQAENIPRHEIPVNKYQHRLDAYIPPSTAEERATFHARIAIQKLCNNYHLHGSCSHGDSCEYDHTPASPATVNCLRQVASNNPCPRKGACRSLSCLYGHICQKAECKHRGGKLFCKFSPQTHGQDMNVAEYVLGFGAKDGTEDVETAASISGKGSTPPELEARSLQNDSEDEVEGEEEGALLDLEDDASVD